MHAACRANSLPRIRRQVAIKLNQLAQLLRDLIKLSRKIQG